jgi:hypothetical protein
MILKIKVPIENIVAINNNFVPLFKLFLESVELIPDTNINIAQQNSVFIMLLDSLKM